LFLLWAISNGYLNATLMYNCKVIWCKYLEVWKYFRAWDNIL